MVLFRIFLMAFEPAVRPVRYVPNTRPMAAYRVASREALNTLYRLVPTVSCRRMYSSVETARMEVHSFVVDDRAIDLNVDD
jgi:hypothetical protein